MAHRHPACRIMLIALLVLACVGCQSTESPWDTREPNTRWDVASINAWYDAHPWLVGANFLPSTAGNQAEMFRADDFDPETIDRELGYATGIGMNVMRVYLHDAVYAMDPDGFLDRVDRYLAIADKHGIKTLVVFFDDCWRGDLEADTEFEPKPGVHNSIWLQSPRYMNVQRFPDDPEMQARLKTYVQAVIARFKDDDRVLGWDLYNEPGNTARLDDGSNGPRTPEGSLALVKAVFAWAREVDPGQPLTVGVWGAPNFDQPIAAYSLANSDFITFHHYKDAANLKSYLDKLEPVADGRPIVCTEYMARNAQSTFQGALPIMAERNIGAINWGFAAGRSNTIYPWESWKNPGRLPEPDVWFHDIVRPDGSPFDPEETRLIRKLTRRHRPG